MEMKDRSYPRRLALLTLGLALLLAVAVPALAEQPAPQLPAFEHATMVSATALEGGALGSGAGMRAAIDPRTGELRQPSRAELRELDRQRPQRPARAFAASQVERPDGTVMMAVDEELMNFSVAHTGAGFACVEGAAHADLHFLSMPAPAVEEK